MSPKILSYTILTSRSMLLSHLFMDSKRLHVVIIPILPLLRISLLVHFHQIVLQSLIHTINNTNSIPLRNGNTRNVNMKNAIVKQKESGLFNAIPIHEFKWGTKQIIHGRFIFITISITPWTTNPLNIHVSIYPYSSVTVPSDIEHHSRHSDEVDEKASIICANAIRVVQIQTYLNPWMISDNSVYLSQMNTLESCRWPIDRYLRYEEW